MKDRLEPYAYALLRIVAGGMFLCHGLQKLFGALGGHAQHFGTQLWFGGVIELVGGALVAVGMFTRPAAFLAAGTMAVAYFQFHWKFEFGGARFLPIINDGEGAVLYCFVFLFIAARGSGPWALARRT